MDLRKLKKLIDLVESSGIAELEITEGEEKVKREQEGKGDEWVAEAVRTRPFGRLLEPADTAYAVAYYVSDASACVTGSVMDLEQYPVGAPPAW